MLPELVSHLELTLKNPVLTRKNTVAPAFGLHREQSCLDTSPELHGKEDLGGEASKPRFQAKDIELKNLKDRQK